jgi:hypothetical protein
MGRPATTGDRVTLKIDPKLKERAAVWALKNKTTLSAMTEEGWRLVMAGGTK